MPQQIAIPLRFVGPDGSDIPIDGYVAVRKAYFDALRRAAKDATDLSASLMAHLAGGNFRGMDLSTGNLLEAVRNLQLSVLAMEEIDRHQAALDESKPARA